MVTILIPGPLRIHTRGQAEISVAGSSVRQALLNLIEQFAEVQRQLFSDQGELHRFVNIFINNDDIRMRQGIDSPLVAGDVIEILPAISGGNQFQDLRARLELEIPQISIRSLVDEMSAGAALVVDVRSSEERAQGYIPGSLHLDRGYLEIHAERQLPDKQSRVVVCCASGLRSLLAADTLRSLGYTQVASLAGGFDAWKSAGLDFVQPKFLSESQRRRYLRHLSLPEVKEEGQLKLLNARVLCVGAGGLGSPILMYLAAAGIGTLGIVDNDVVDISNLQRQVIHTTDRVGKSKTTSARHFIEHLNPDSKVIEHNLRLNGANALELLREYDVIVDGSDNFTTRYLVNDACVQLGKPFVHGSIFRFDGQMSVFLPGKGPCYRCLYPVPPTAELAPSCSDAGVLGILPGVIGLLCAVETIKLLLDIGRPISGRLISYDALNTRFRELNVQRNPECTHCAAEAWQGKLEDSPEFCTAH